MRVLGIETSCDETACAVVDQGHKILSNVIYSQLDLHAQYGGVFPEMASRSHVEKIPLIVQEALDSAATSLEEIDLIAVTQGPGLIGSLLIGLNTAKALAYALKKPLIGVNHVEAHLYAGLMPKLDSLSFPLLGIVVSGGHTSLVLIEKLGSYDFLGATQDDAMGEAFDKVGKLMGLSYPGGPEIESLAKKGDPSKVTLTSGKVKGAPLDFSFSGIKTQVLYRVKGQNAKKDAPILLSESEKADLCASFQQTVFEDLAHKMEHALKKFAVKGIVFGGGVTASKTLKQFIEERFSSHKLYWPAKDLSLDNAAMIAGLGYQKFIEKGKSDPLDIEALPRIRFA